VKVADVMRAPVRAVTPETTIGEAVVTLADAHISAVPVVDARGGLIGVLSSTDVLTAIAEAEDAERRGRLFGDTMVKDLMTARPVTIDPDADVSEAARQMLYLEVHRLFVTDKDTLIGVISQTDIVGAVATARL
jgi:CBS domain-containing membrane protein